MGRGEYQTRKCARAEALRCHAAREHTTTESFKMIMKDELIKTCLPAIKLRRIYHYKIM